MRWLGLFAWIAAVPAGAAYDANGVALGSDEATVIKNFPETACQALQWASRAADRRCDGKATFGGVTGRITFYLKADRVQAFDLRFDTADAARLAEFLKKRYGAPTQQTQEKVLKLQWEKGGERAVLTSQAQKRRGFFTVSRGDFEEEIYRVR